MSGKKPYLPNNWQQWKEVPDEFLYSPTYEEFVDWKLRGWELPSSVCCIIRETTSRGKIKEHVYQKHHAAKNKVRQLMLNNSEFIVCTDSELQFVKPHKDDDFDFD